MSDSINAISTRAASRVGRTLREKWRLDRLLGIGGMAAVYAGTHRNGSRGAIKMLHVELSVEPEIRARFLREGYVANAVGHPGAVRVIDDDVAEDGAVFLVMELLSGETLEARWERKDRRLTPMELLPAVDQLLDVLAAAHERGIIHRDIKPENVFINHDGTVKLLDFGIARLRDVTSITATKSGAALGTPAFMPPEQAMGSSSDIGPTTDLWALGASMFLLLSGNTVHDAPTANAQLVKTATTHARSVASMAPELPASVVALVDRALAFERADRWPSARAMQAAARAVYEELAGGAMSRAAPLSVPAPRESAALHGYVPHPTNATTGGASARAVGVSMAPPRSRRRVVIAVGAVALAVGAGSVFLWGSRHPIPTTPAVAVVATTSASAVIPPPTPPVSASAEPPNAPAAASSTVVLSARLSVYAQGGACDITIDGEPAGRTPIEGAAVAPGEHRVACLLAKGGVVTRRVKATVGKPATVAFAMVSADPMDKRK